MKKMLLVALATLFVALQATAQEPTKEEQKQMRQALRLENQCNELAAAMMLNDEQTAQFKPIYVRYTNDMRALRGKYKMHRPKPGSIKSGEPAEPLTDQQIEENIRNRFALSRAIVDVREKYYEEFRTFLNPKQIEKMYKPEKKQGEQMHRAHQNKKGKPGARPNGAQKNRPAAQQPR